MYISKRAIISNIHKKLVLNITIHRNCQAVLWGKFHNFTQTNKKYEAALHGQHPQDSSYSQNTAPPNTGSASKPQGQHATDAGKKPE